MDVRLDQPAAGQAPAGIVGFRPGCQAVPDGDDFTAHDPDIDRLAAGQCASRTFRTIRSISEYLATRLPDTKQYTDYIRDCQCVL